MDHTYQHISDGSAVILFLTADVRNFDIRRVPKYTSFAFGFPCNDFSTVGEHRGLDGDYGALYTYGVHALALHSPEWFIAENVSGLSRARSEEHTSELQSRFDLVCRLLLEKKKKNI